MARKAKATEKKHKVILTLDAKMHKELKETANKLSLPVASLARMWIAEALQKKSRGR